METDFFLKMEDDEKELLKKKYSIVIGEIKAAFVSYQSVHKLDMIEIDWEWDDYFIKINAESKLIEKDHYRITINLFNVAYLERMFNKKNIEQKIAFQMIATILSFTAWHEISHILFGHCTIPKQYEKDISNLQKRQIETMADLNASYLFLSNMFVAFSDASTNVKEERFSMLLAVMYIYFKELEEIQNIGEIKYVPESTVTDDGRTHLFSTLRFELICNEISYVVERQFQMNKDNIEKSFHGSLKWLEYFGYEESLQINPLYRRNHKHLLSTICDDYSWLDKVIQKKYL